MPSENVAVLAAAFLDARGGAAKLSRARADALSLTVEDAYAVQRGVAAGLGPVGGFKFAQRPGEAAIMAPIHAADIRPSPATAPTGGEAVGVELEVGFRILAAPPDPEAPDFRERLRACVAPLAVIELVQARLVDPDAAAPLLRLADHQLNGGLVTGSGPVDWQGGALAEVAVHLSFDGKTAVEGPVRLPFGDAFECLARLVAMAGSHCGGVQPGQIVITGSLNGLPWIAPGTAVRGRIGGIGEVEVDLAG